MIRLLLIRHGETYGNRLSRYIGGRTDEPLTEEGKEALKRIRESEILLLEKSQICFQTCPIYVSPMLRCRETSEILFPNRKTVVVEDLRECDFGIFENRNYKELSEEPEYQRWIDSNASLPFPGGESRESFLARSQRGLEEVLCDCVKTKTSHAILVVHGGTIMNLMHSYASEKRDFYDWHVKNGRGYQVSLDEGAWFSGNKKFCLEKSFS